MDVEGPSRGYILEIYDGHFVLPDLGPIGRNFFSLVFMFETKDTDFCCITVK